MKNVLVLGATGAMGIYLVRKFSEKGYKVDAVSLDKVTDKKPNVTYYNFDAKDDILLKDFLNGKRYNAIVDFMLYFTEEFEKRHKLLLESTEHYIFLSSYRVYSNDENPIKETSPRLLDASDDKEFLKRVKIEYGLYKACQEDVLRQSGFKNWTILRPTMVYSTYRYQLVGLEANTFLYRAQQGKTVVLPESAMDVHAAMTWSGDVANMIEGLVLNPNAFGETFTIGSSEKNTWRDVLNYYQQVVDFNYVLVSNEEYKTIFLKDYIDWNVNLWYQHIYDRFFDRQIDNSKILSYTGLKQEDFMPLKDGLKKELLTIKDKYVWQESLISRSMDEFLKERKN